MKQVGTLRKLGFQMVLGKKIQLVVFPALHKGSFNLEWTKMDILHTIYPLSHDPLDFLLSPLPPSYCPCRAGLL